MKSCPRCRRHVRHAEQTCPFCDAALREAAAPLAAALSLATLLVGCTDGPSPESDTGGTQSTTAADSTSSLSGSGAIPTSSDSGPFETTAVDDDTTTNDTLTGGGFIYGSATEGPVAIECDVYEQDCPDAEKCMPWANDGGEAWNATRCTPVMEDPGRPGDPCTVEGGPTSGIDSCDRGVACWDVDAVSNMGTCVAMCSGTADAPICEVPMTECVVDIPDVVALCRPA